MRKICYLVSMMMFFAMTPDAFGVDMSNIVENAEDHALQQISPKKLAADWLEQNPVPKSCPIGFHPESGYWYDENSFFAWSECTKDGFFRNAEGLIQKLPK